MILFALLLCFTLLVLYALYEQKQWEKQLQEIRRRRRAKLYRKIGRSFRHMSWALGTAFSPVFQQALKSYIEFGRSMKALQVLISGPGYKTLNDPPAMSEEEIRQAMSRDARG